MNPVQKTIRARLNRLPAELAPLKAAALRYLRFCSAIDTDETLLIAHQPWDAPLSYLIRLYPGAKKPWFAAYQKQTRLKIPPAFQRFLVATNGCFVFGMSIFGMPPSMLRTPGLLDRSQLQCHDLATGDQHWKLEYRVDSGWFHFGSRDYSDTELAGYFLDGKNHIHSLTKRGQTVGEWSRFRDFLHDELAASEKLSCSAIPRTWWHQEFEPTAAWGSTP